MIRVFVTFCAVFLFNAPKIGFANTTTCTATEAELFEHFATTMGTFGANGAVIRVSNAPTTKVVSRNPFTYEISDAELCAELGKS